MSQPVRVSTIIPAYNAAAYIGDTMTSALAQTHANLEIIVVDDGSSDDTCQVVRSFGDGVRLEQQRNGGAAVARNRGAAVATGEWLAFLDADDLWRPDKTAIQLGQVEADTALVYSDRRNIGTLEGLPEIQSELQPLVDGDIFDDLLLANVITTSTVMIRTSVFRELGGFSEDPHLPPAEDWDLWLRVAEEHRIRAVREPLVQYRLHASGVSRNVARMIRARGLVIGGAMARARGAALPSARQRRVWSATWIANGFDAGRAGDRRLASEAYRRAIASWPFEHTAYKAWLKVLLGRA